MYKLRYYNQFVNRFINCVKIFSSEAKNKNWLDITRNDTYVGIALLKRFGDQFYSKGFWD